MLILVSAKRCCFKTLDNRTTIAYFCHALDRQDHLISHVGSTMSNSKNPLSPNLGKIIQSFAQDLSSLQETLPLSMISIDLIQIISKEIFTTYTKPFSKMDKVSATRYLESLGEEYLTKLVESFQRKAKAETAQKLVARSFIVSLVSLYDAFVGSLVRSVYLRKPDLLSGSERQITFSELMSFGNIDLAVEHIIDKEIETLLRKSHVEQFSWMASKFSTKLEDNSDHWRRFIEVTQRRNLFVHANGRVSQQYLDVCLRNLCFTANSVNRNDQLDADFDYFDTAYESFLIISIKLAHSLWRKLLPLEIVEADGNLIDIGMTLLNEQKFSTANLVFKFAGDLPRFSSEKTRLTIAINLAQSYKWMGDEKMCTATLNKIDWSASEDIFKLCHSVLLENYSEATKIMTKIGAFSSPTKAQYKTWPVFRKFRTSSEFTICYNAIFGEVSEAIGSDERKIEEENPLMISLTTLHDLIKLFSAFFRGKIPLDVIQAKLNTMTLAMSQHKQSDVPTHGEQSENGN